MWNEPNLGEFNWQPAAEPEYYAEVLRAVNDAVDGVRPGLPVISGGIGPPGFPRPSGSIGAEEFLERMYRAGARGAMDGIGVHPYPATRPPDDPERQPLPPAGGSHDPRRAPATTTCRCG